MNASDQSVFLHGVNRAGTEYSCIQNNGFFDGTGTSFTQEDAQITSMAAWGINSELITLNEDCWLGINGSPVAYSDPSASPPTPGCSAAQCSYANAIENLVKTDEANHIYPVISLFALAPGTTRSTGHISLADNDHAPLFWEEVATFFKNDPYVMFRLEQEPTLSFGSESDWQCWAQGDVSYSTSSVSTPPTPPTSTGTPNKCQTPGLTTFQTVGMQSLVNIVRGTGSANPIMLPGLAWSNMLSCGPSTSPSTCGMLNSATPPVTDPIAPAQLMASVDVYPEGNSCGQQLNTSCYDATYKPVAQVMPLVAGETAENPNNGYTPTTYVDMFLNWMDANANGYYPYAWDPWAQLIASYTNNSTPSSVWGTDYYDHINHITPPSPAQPTDGITFVQSVPAPCVGLSNGSIGLTSAVNAGDDLFAVFGGHGWTSAASTIDSVSDNVNGAWTRVAWSGSHASGNYNVSYSVFELLNSKAAPSGLTLTVNGTNGQSGSSGVVLDARGVASVNASSFQSTLQSASSTYTGPTVSSVPANNVVLGLWGSYSNGETFTAPLNWNTQSSYQVAPGTCGAAAIDWTQPSSTGSVTATINSTISEPHYGGAIDLQP